MPFEIDFNSNGFSLTILRVQNYTKCVLRV